MNRRHLILAASGLGTVAAAYAWRERRGLIRSDLAPGPPPTIAPALASILDYASLAPSGHNAQPWSVRVSGNEIRVGSLPSRWLPKVDPENRELALSMGAFLENLLVAAPHHGFTAEYRVTALHPSESNLLEVSLKSAMPRIANLSRIRTRRTLRSGHLARGLSAEDARSLASYFQGQAHFFAAGSREARYLEEGTIEANRAQALRDDAQAELAEWIRWSDAEGRAHCDGLTPESMEITGPAGWYVRHFMSRANVSSQSFREQGLEMVRKQVAACGGWLVVTSPDNSVPSLIETGRRTQQMWLQVRDRSIAIHPMTQMLEEDAFRERVAPELGITGQVQFILRVSYVARYPDPVSLRRPVSAILRA